MINPTDFHRMWICVPANLRELLAEGEVLTCSHEQVQFALAPADQMPAAEQRRAQLAEDRPAYILPVTPAVLAALNAGESIEVRVLADEETVVGSIRLTGEANDQLRTEHGRLQVLSTVASRLKAGDFFAISERTDPWRDWVVYRALADFADGQVTAQRTSPHSQPEVTFEGENQVVFLLSDRQGMLELLGWDDLPVAVD